MAEPDAASFEAAPPIPDDIRHQGPDAVLDWMAQQPAYSAALERKVGDMRCATGGHVRAAAPAALGENPLLTSLHSQYDALSVDRFQTGTKPKWETVSAKLTPDALAKAANLESPKIYGVNVQNGLLIGDGGSEVPQETLKQDYPTARSAAQAKGLSLLRRDEYEFFNTGQFEVRTITWLESGDAPDLALDAYWRVGRVGVLEDGPRRRLPSRGARRVLRIKI